MEDSEKQVREVQKAVRDLDRDADQMEDRRDKLGSEIDEVRQEFERRRNDENVPGLPPEPKAAHEQEDDTGAEGPRGDADNA